MQNVRMCQFFGIIPCFVRLGLETTEFDRRMQMRFSSNKEIFSQINKLQENAQGNVRADEL